MHSFIHLLRNKQVFWAQTRSPWVSRTSVFFFTLFLACFSSGNGSWPSPSCSLPGWLLPPGTSSQPCEPGTQVSKLSCRLQARYLEGSRNHHSLFLVTGWQEPIEHIDLVQGSLAPHGPGGQCASHYPPEDVAGLWGWATGWVGVQLLVEESQVLQRVFVEIARGANAFIAHDHNLLAQQHLLSHSGLQVAQEMAPAIEHQASAASWGKNPIFNPKLCHQQKSAKSKANRKP